MSNELERYERHVMLRQIGPEGQRKIRKSRVLCVGAGGLGSAVALYLGSAGVGVLGLADDDRVELSNLPRQLLHGTPDIGRPKVESARDSIRRLNPEVEVVVHPIRLDEQNAIEVASIYDIVVDASDNLATRQAINKACVRLRKAYVYGAVSEFEGQVSVLAPHMGGPCYQCMYPAPAGPDCASVPARSAILNTVPGIIGCIQATETLKLIVGCGTPLIGRLIAFDALSMSFRELKTRRDPACRICGQHSDRNIQRS